MQHISIIIIGAKVEGAGEACDGDAAEKEKGAGKMSRLKESRQFIETRQQIYESADEIAEILGVHALVDILLEWADDAFHGEVFRSLEDEREEARLIASGVPHGKV